MKILYNIPSLESVYAARFIYEGYKDAFLELGHEFRPLTSADDQKKIFEKFGKKSILLVSVQSLKSRSIMIQIKERSCFFEKNRYTEASNIFNNQYCLEPL